MAVSEVTLEVIRAGDPEHCKGSIVFVHGICHGAWCWKYFLDYFPKHGYYCFALSLRGHGNSENNKKLGKCTLSDYAEDVRWAVEQCTEETHGMKPFLLGHSMGGGVVQAYIGRHADKVKGAILFAAATAGGIGYGNLLPGKGRSTASAVALLNLKICLAGSAFFRHRVSKEDLQLAKDKLQSESWRVVFGLLKPYTDHNPQNIPVFVIGTEKDSYFPAKSLRHTAEAYHTSPTILPELCHDMMLDKDWEKSAAHVLKFLDSVVPAES